MGAGRPPKPTAIKELEGNPGKRKLNKDEPKFTAIDTANPFRFDGQGENPQQAAYAEWARLSSEFSRLGLLTIGSRQTLYNICVTWAGIVECDAKVASEGMWIQETRATKAGETYTVEARNDAVDLGVELRGLYNRLLNEFGGNPSSASKVATQTKPAGDKPGNSFAAKLAAVQPINRVG